MRTQAGPTGPQLAAGWRSGPAQEWAEPQAGDPPSGWAPPCPALLRACRDCRPTHTPTHPLGLTVPAGSRSGT